ncbi:MAG: UDP-N-acetylglucosamine 2-epimerase (non-hydrolyzing) [bacterium]|nr:UDP-N-acetylglucosamine 2-epimerase (non-hydrolyzing) [bacterium]
MTRAARHHGDPPDVLVVFGTRPEIIKLVPVVHALEQAGIRVATCLFRQHTALADQALRAFSLTPTYDLPVSLSDQALFSSAASVVGRLWSLARSGMGLLRFLRILRRRPKLLVVQGDTSTVFIAAFLAFHLKIPIAHVEAGLRTYDKYRPFPEEMNRTLVSRLADVHFAPTPQAAQNLRREGIDPSRIHLVGNTAIDALRATIERLADPREAVRVAERFRSLTGIDVSQTTLVLATAHRRESFGTGLTNIFQALRTLSAQYPNLRIVLPAHPNPNVERALHASLDGVPGVCIVPPLDYELFVWLMRTAVVILTDSGGVQEEASFLGTPVVILRDVTERPEVVTAGAAVLAGTDPERIVLETEKILDDSTVHAAMAVPRTLFGDGHAADRIADVCHGFLRDHQN